MNPIDPAPKREGSPVWMKALNAFNFNSVCDIL